MGEVYPEGPHAGAAPPSAPLKPIDLVLWVGVTDVPPTTPNGTAVTDGTAGPFANLQDAFDFVTAIPVGSNTKATYYVNSTPGAGAYTTPTTGAHNIIGLDARTPIGAITISPEEEGDLQVSCHNLQGILFLSGGTGHIILTISNDGSQNGGLGAPDLVLSDAFGGLTELVWVNGFVQACISATSNARFYDCIFPSQGTIQLRRIDTAANCDIDANNTIAVADVPQGLGFVGCNFHNGPVEFQGPPGSIVLDPESGLTFNTATVLSGGATTDRAGDIGKVLTIVAPGLPRWV